VRASALVRTRIFAYRAAQLGDENSDEEDPFAEVEVEFTDEGGNLEENVARDKFARLTSFVQELVDALSTNTDGYDLQESCLQLVSGSHSAKYANG
jgi:hypothetical protein